MVVVPPAVPHVDVTRDGTDLVVNITGVDDLFVELAPQLISFAQGHGSRVVALASTAAGQKIRSSGLAITIRARHDARDALANLSLIHICDRALLPVGRDVRRGRECARGAGLRTVGRSTPRRGVVSERGLRSSDGERLL